MPDSLSLVSSRSVWIERRRWCLLVAVFAIPATIACDKRPANVPADATPVNFNGNGGWQQCALDDGANEVIRCRNWDRDGNRFYAFCSVDDPRNEPFPPDSDIFVPYGNVAALRPSDLKIDNQHTGMQFVWLDNGVVLMPDRRECEYLKHFIDELRAAGHSR